MIRSILTAAGLAFVGLSASAADTNPPELASYAAGKLTKRDYSKLLKKAKDSDEKLYIAFRYQVEVLNDPVSALKLLNKYGRDCSLHNLCRAMLKNDVDLLNKVGADRPKLAGELYGDWAFDLKKWAEAKKSYSQALKVSKRYEKKEDISAWDKAVNSRIRSKISKVNRQIDIEKLGAGYVEYRDAQHLRLKQERYIAAYYAYDALIKKYPESMYSMAAKCYKLKCILAPSSKDKEMKLTGRDKVASKRVRLFKPEIPAVGVEAGLYAAEMNLDLGMYYLSRDVKKAESYFSNVIKCAQLEVKGEIPPKAKEASQPPREQRKKDSFGNVTFTGVAYDKLFNRLTCDWYLTEMKVQALMYGGLCSYVKKDYETANKRWKNIAKVDSFYNKKKSKSTQHFMTGVDRLLWNVKHNKGAIFGDPEEMKAFKDHQLLLVFIADLALETDDYTRAKKRYLEIKPKNLKQEAYIHYCLCWIEGRIGNHRKMINMYADFTEKYKGTQSAIKGGLMYAKAILQSGGGLLNEGEVEKAHEALSVIVKTRHKVFADQACFTSCIHRFSNSKKDISHLKPYAKKFPKGEWIELVNHLIKNKGED